MIETMTCLLACGCIDETIEDIEYDIFIDAIADMLKFCLPITTQCNSMNQVFGDSSE